MKAGPLSPSTDMYTNPAAGFDAADAAAIFDSAIFDSTAAFDAYLADVRERRERRRKARAQRDHWLRAAAALEEERRLAEQEGDAEIALELSGVLEEFARRLRDSATADTVAFRSHAAISTAGEGPFPASRGAGVLPRPDAGAKQTPRAVQAGEAPGSAAGEIAARLNDAAREGAALADAPGPSASEPIITYPSAASLLATIITESSCEELALIAPDGNRTAEILNETTLAAPPEPSGPESSAPELSEEERAARAQPLRVEMDAIAAQWGQMDAEGLMDKHGLLRRPQAFALRALTCRVGSAYARARESGVGAELRTDVRRLRNKLELAREFANDRAECPPFADECWGDHAQRLTSEEWEHLAARYADTEQAQAAYHWYCDHQDALGQPFQLDLLNAIGAVQQSLFRALSYLGGGDRLQGDLYGDLLKTAQPVGYLSTLRPEMPDAELETIGATLPDLMRRADQEQADNKTRQAKEARKNDAMASADAFFAQNPTAGASEAMLAADRKKLLPILKECLAAGMPPTNVQVRNALLLHGPRLLADQAGCERILEAVLAERRRRGMDVLAREPEDTVEEEPSDTAVAEFVQMVRPFTEGQKLLILGGVPRQRVCEELEQTLGCAEVKWPQSKKSDRASKFQTDIKRADMLLLIKNFASHDMSEKGREWIKGAGGHFVFIPSGYGVNQLINQLYKYVLSDKARS